MALLNAGDVFIADLYNAILLTLVPRHEPPSIGLLVTVTVSLVLFRLFPLLELQDLLLGELCSSSKSALAALRYRSRSYLLRWL